MSNDSSLSNMFFSGRTVLITGGTGSLGRELIRYLLAHENPEKVICLSRRWQEQESLRREFDSPKLRTFIGDVRDMDRMLLALDGVDYVIHTAAIKSVVDCEYSPMEAVQTNVMGSWNVLRAAIECNVKRVMVVSTDKCVQAVNVYGKSKAMMESLSIASNAYAGKKQVRFSIARYGNVAGSSGSVVPLFRDQIHRTGIVTVTNPGMTRFFIKMEDAVEFVVTCLKKMEGGEIFVPKLKSTTIELLIDTFARVYPKRTFTVKEIGIRPGEKIHEWMIASDEESHTRDLGWAYCVEPQFPFWGKIKRGMEFVKADFGGQGYTSLTAPRFTLDELEALIKNV